MIAMLVLSESTSVGSCPGRDKFCYTHADVKIMKTLINLLGPPKSVISTDLFRVFTINSLLFKVIVFVLL